MRKPFSLLVALTLLAVRHRSDGVAAAKPPAPDVSTARRLAGLQQRRRAPTRPGRHQERATAARSRQDRRHEDLARARMTTAASSTSRTTRCVASGPMSRCGSPTTCNFPNTAHAQPADAGPNRLLHLQRLPQRRRPQRHHRRPGQLPDRPVRQQHVPDRVGLVEHAAEPQRQQGRCSPSSSGFPKSYYRGEGDNIVVLVDNVRDSNFYDQNNANTQLVHRRASTTASSTTTSTATVMSIDAWDWLHRTAADPPHDPTDRSVHQRARAAVPVRGRLRARVPAPAAPLHRSGRGQLGQRGPERLHRGHHRLRRPLEARRREGLRQPHPVLPRLGERRRAATGTRSRGPAARRTG